MIEPQVADLAALVEHLHDEVRVLLELIDQVLRRGLAEIDLAGLQRADRRLLVGDVLEDHPIDLDDLAAGGAGRRFGARPIIRVAVIDVAIARAGLVAIEQERPRPDGFPDLLVRIGLGFLPAHHEALRALDFRERLEHQPVRLRQHDAEGPFVDDRRVFDAPEQMLPATVARRPAPQRGNAVGRRHAGAVGERQAIAQLERIGEPVIRLVPAADHLGLRRERGIEREQIVVDHPAVDRGDRAGGPDRIEHPQVRVHHRADGTRRRRRGACRQDHGRRKRGERAGEKAAACGGHAVFSVPQIPPPKGGGRGGGSHPSLGIRGSHPTRRRFAAPRSPVGEGLESFTSSPHSRTG